MLGQEDLLFRALDGRGEVDVVGFFEFLARLRRNGKWLVDCHGVCRYSVRWDGMRWHETYDVGQLRLCDQALGFCADEFLL